jgi:hypothetical protein
MRNLPLLLLALACPAVARAAPLVVTADFAGFDEVVSTRTDTDLGKMGWNACGFHGTTSQPALAFTVAQPLPGLALELAETDAGAVLVRGAQFRCIRPGRLSIDDAGDYKLFLLESKSASRTHARVRLSLAAQDAARALQDPAVPTLKLEPQGANPRYGRSEKAVTVDAAVAKLDCAHGPVRLLARLQVDQASTYALEAERSHVHVQAADGRCQPELQGRAGRFELAAGSYTLWAEAREGGALDFVANDEERGPSFDGVPVVEIHELPAVVRARSSSERLWRPSWLCGPGPRQPAFIASVPRALEAVSVSRAAGPDPLGIEGLGARPVCGKSEHHLDALSGRWPVWLPAKEAREVLIKFADAHEEVSPLWLAPGPTEGLPLAERELLLHYPFWDTHPVYDTGDAASLDATSLALYAEAPAGLFVFLTKEIDGIPTTEPLILMRAGERAEVLRIDHTTHAIRLGALTTEVPGRITTPEVRQITPAKTVEEADRLAGILDRKTVDAFAAKKQKLRSCTVDYMEKHDPAWDHDYKLVYVHSGVSTTDLAYAQADRACGRSQFDRDSKKYIAAINAAQRSLRTRIGAVLAKKLGR